MSRLAQIVKSLIDGSESRIRGSTFELLRHVSPKEPLSREERKELSTQLAYAYRPPMYSTDGAASAVASEHAKIIWAVSNGLGDKDATTTRGFLQSLRNSKSIDQAVVFDAFSVLVSGRLEELHQLVSDIGGHAYPARYNSKESVTCIVILPKGTTLTNLPPSDIQFISVLPLMI